MLEGISYLRNGIGEFLFEDSDYYLFYEVGVVVDLKSYVLDVFCEIGEWYIFEIDLDFIGEGCGIFGIGGGGFVYLVLFYLWEILWFMLLWCMCVVEFFKFLLEVRVVMIVFVGVLFVFNEWFISGDELLLVLEVLFCFLGIKGYDVIMVVEIGGLNGMCMFVSVVVMDILIVDVDIMGRVFLKVDMVLLYVFGEVSFVLVVLLDVRGNV